MKKFATILSAFSLLLLAGVAFADSTPFVTQTATATSTPRCSELHFSNHLGTPPAAVLVYETETRIGTAPVILTPDPRHIQVQFSPTGAFPEIDTTTNAPTGNMITHAQVYQMLYSLSAAALAERNAADAAQSQN